MRGQGGVRERAPLKAQETLEARLWREATDALSAQAIHSSLTFVGAHRLPTIPGVDDKDLRAKMIAHLRSPECLPEMAHAALLLLGDEMAHAVLDNPVLGLLMLEAPRLVEAKQQRLKRLVAGEGNRLFPHPGQDGNG